jgi:hypothetical protein
MEKQATSSPEYCKLSMISKDTREMNKNSLKSGVRLGFQAVSLCVAGLSTVVLREVGMTG